MEKKTAILNREKLSSNYINSKQDFGKVLSGHQKLKPPLWKKPLFYGSIGVASLALILTVVNISSSPVRTDEISTKQNKILTANFSSPSNTLKSTEGSLNSELLAVALENESSESETLKEVILPKSIQKIEKTPEIIADEVVASVQKEEVSTEIVPVINRESISFPRLAGVFTGDITIDDFCSKRGIECVDNSYGVTSYTIEYFNGRTTVTSDVKGYKIPSSVCELIHDSSIGNQVFITNIKAENRTTGNRISLNSMNLNPVK